MDSDFDYGRRKRRPFFLNWRPLLQCLTSRPSRVASPQGRHWLLRCLQRCCRPWIFSSIILCLFCGSLFNGRPRVTEEMHHCVRRRQVENSMDLAVYSDEPPIYDDRMTLILNSFHRQSLMQQSIKHYARCTNALRQIRVVWMEDEPPPMSRINPRGVDVIYDVMNSSSLNSRFYPVEGLQTEAVMSIDDDIYTPCYNLRRALDVWKENKRALVGFFPRAHGINQDCKYTYYLGTHTYVEGKYSIVLTKAAVFHRDFLTIYTEQMPQSIRDYVDEKHNCEDLAMQMLIANHTTKPSVFVNTPWIWDYGKDGPHKVPGISSDGKHTQQRTGCLNDLTAMFNNVPLLFEPLDKDGGIMKIAPSGFSALVTGSLGQTINLALPAVFD